MIVDTYSDAVHYHRLKLPDHAYRLDSVHCVLRADRFPWGWKVCHEGWRVIVQIDAQGSLKQNNFRLGSSLVKVFQVGWNRLGSAQKDSDGKTPLLFRKPVIMVTLSSFNEKGRRTSVRAVFIAAWSIYTNVGKGLLEIIHLKERKCFLWIDSRREI